MTAPALPVFAAIATVLVAVVIVPINAQNEAERVVSEDAAGASYGSRIVSGLLHRGSVPGR